MNDIVYETALNVTHLKGVELGTELENTRIMDYAKHRICFDNEAGSCQHSACYALQDLVKFLGQK
jgi:hypothetical protein